MSDKIIAIGASAGGLSALKEMLAELPAGFGAPIIVAIHSGPDSMLTEVLDISKSVALEVRRVEDEDRPVKGVVHVVPGAKHVFLSHGLLRLSETVRESGFRPSIDALFMTMAAEFGTNAIAVVLSGTLNDGMRGAQVIHDMGGITVVQDPDDADHADMPQSVINADHPREVLSAKDLGIWLRDLIADQPR